MNGFAGLKKVSPFFLNQAPGYYMLLPSDWVANHAPVTVCGTGGKRQEEAQAALPHWPSHWGLCSGPVARPEKIQDDLKVI